MSYTGLKFEQDFQRNIPKDVFSTKLKTSGFGYRGVDNTCDFLIYNGESLFFLELKKTEGKSLPFSNIRENQLDGLLKANKIVNTVCGILINFHRYEETYFVDIEDINSYIQKNIRKSFPYKWVKGRGVLIPQSLRRTRYDYDVRFLLEESGV